MTSIIRSACLSQPTAHVTSSAAELQSTGRSTDVHSLLAFPRLHHGVGKVTARRQPLLQLKRPPRLLATTFIGQRPSSSGEIGAGIRMAISIDRPLESTVETNGTAYSFDDDPPDMPGLKKSNERFKLPHVTELYPDIVPKYSTFSTKSSCLIRHNVQGPLRAKELGKMFVDDRDRVLLKVIRYAHASSSGAECRANDDCTFEHWWLTRAGPRSHIFFEPAEVKAAIVTCGGLCPGLNDVIRQIALTLSTYGVTDVKGIAYGYKGFIDDNIQDIDLTPQSVNTIHLMGGSILGSSRGNSKTSEIVDNIEKRGTNMLFVIGGNGSHAGAMAIHQECFRRKLKVAVVGVVCYMRPIEVSLES